MTTPAATTPALLNSIPTGYGSKFDDHLLEQYKLYVDSSQKLSDRRLSTNNYLLAINSSLLTLLGLFASLISYHKPLIMIPIAGFLLSLAWFLLLTSFKRLNGAKFDVIHELEGNLPANVFKNEWHLLKSGKRRPYTAMSDLERLVPVLFLIFYSVVAVFILTWPVSKEEKIQKIQIQSPVNIELGGATTQTLPKTSGIPSETKPEMGKKASKD
jgi:hypothetical protein